MKKYLASALVFIFSSLLGQSRLDSYNLLNKVADSSLTAQSSTQDIKKTCRKLLAQYHPDKNQNKSAQEQETINKLFIDINNACDTLMGAKTATREAPEAPKKSKDLSLTKALEEAIQKIDLQAALNLLKKNADPNSLRVDGLPLMVLAATKKGSQALALMKALVEYGGDVNILGATDHPPLYAAVAYADPDLVEFLINQGAEVNRADSSGATPLYEAADFCRLDNGQPNLSRVEVAKLLLKYKAKAEGESSEHVPLIKAAQNNCNEFVQLLLSATLDPNIPNQEGRTALWYAVSNNNKELAKILLNNGAEADILDNHDKSLFDEFGNNPKLQDILEFVKTNSKTRSKSFFGDIFSRITGYYA